MELSEDDIHELVSSLVEDDVIRVASLLLDAAREVMNRHDGTSSSYPLLLKAIENRALKCTKLLLEKGADPNCANTRGETPLIWAISRGDFPLVKRLVECGADVTLQHGAEETHPLLRAAGTTKCGVDIMLFLLEAGGPTCLTTEVLSSLLSPAVLFNSSEKVRCLLDAGADVNHKLKSGFSVLDLAMERGFFDVAKLLLRRGAFVRKDSLLSLHAWVPDKSFLEALIEAGASVNAADCMGYSPLIAAVDSSDLEAARVLLQHGANIYMAIHIAAANGQMEFVKELVQFGAMPDLQLPSEGDEEITPFTAAAASDQYEMVHYFLDIWFLHETDVKYVVYSKEIRENIQIYENCYELETILCQPLSLKCLSFVTVSNAVGFGHGRSERVTKLCLPIPLQEKLMFRHG